MGNEYFKNCVGRDQLLWIIRCLKSYPICDYSLELRDPLCHSRLMLEGFGNNSTTLAVLTRASSLNENTVRCKGRTAARSDMKNKSVRLGLPFYAVARCKDAQWHTMWDKGSRNTTGVPPVEAYVTRYLQLRRAFERTWENTLIKKESSSALWCIEIAHQTLLCPR